MIKPWLFEFFPELGGLNVDPDPADVAAHFARYLDLWVRDEALGFEGIFFSEHHFGRSFSGSPNLLIAALAQRTKALRLGVMGIVLPYWLRRGPTERRSSSRSGAATIRRGWWRRSACWII